MYVVPAGRQLAVARSYLVIKSEAKQRALSTEKALCSCWSAYNVYAILRVHEGASALSTKFRAWPWDRVVY